MVVKWTIVSRRLGELVFTVKSKGKISQNFVAFSEYMNFTCNIYTFLASVDICHQKPGIGNDYHIVSSGGVVYIVGTPEAH